MGHNNLLFPMFCAMAEAAEGFQVVEAIIPAERTFPSMVDRDIVLRATADTAEGVALQNLTAAALIGSAVADLAAIGQNASSTASATDTQTGEQEFD